MLKFLFLSLLFTSNAFAYKFTRDFENGFYWQSLPISISVLENGEAPFSNGTLSELTRTAANEWESATGVSLWELTDTSGTQNIVRWSNKFSQETSMDESSVLAVAIRYTEGPYFAKTEIVINGKHPLNRNLSYLATTIKHELGHTMGLDHSEVQSSVMWPELQVYGKGVDRDDVIGMSEAHNVMIERQLTRYVSPLAYEKQSEGQALSCGTISTSSQVVTQGLLSLISGILISFIRIMKSKFKLSK